MVKNKKINGLNKVFFQRKNTKGWLKIVEAFLAILLLITILLLAVNTRYLNVEKDQIFYNEESKILKSFQINETIRNEILKVNPPLNSSDSEFPSLIRESVENQIPVGMNCSITICNTGVVCDPSLEISKSVFVKEILIIGNQTKYSPRIINLACYKK